MPARRKTSIEMERANIATAVRRGIRLKYGLAATEEINDVLFTILDDFDEALAAGKPYVFDLATVMDDIKRLTA